MYVEEIYGSVQTTVASAYTCVSVIDICRISNDPRQVQFLVSFHSKVIQYLAKVVQMSQETNGLGSNFRGVRILVNIKQGPNFFANFLTKVWIGLGLGHVWLVAAAWALWSLVYTKRQYNKRNSYILYKNRTSLARGVHAVTRTKAIEEKSLRQWT